ncbi:hypothetical protein O6H91_20G027500 [Diphasiastrum complanatum]|uniref:Uncharacterized protein n=1 Tax=Diphasiastrum complanatum TaxID=34168 RepID=A0ACC2ANR7_DIPCM|nr:hypothetical protein O6H91_20G027500 [Diphasiastrum complanatum]
MPYRSGLGRVAANATMTKALLPPAGSVNLMFDPHVFRGPTFHRNKALQEDPALQKKPREVKMKRKAVQLSEKQVIVDGRKNMDVQTDEYLEELVEEALEYEVDTQTDPFLDRPATPLFIPQKPGPDVGTQIEEGDLFNFEEEVEPLLEVLVGRTLEQAWMEVMEEKQLAELHAHQDHFEKIRAAELVATQRMEFSERRKIEEKKRRVEQEKKRLEEERQLKEKIETQTCAREYLKKMVDSVHAYLQSAGYFYDPVEREVETMFLPFLEEKMLEELEKITCARSTLQCLVESVVVTREARASKSAAEILKKIIFQIETKSTELSVLGATSLMEDIVNIVDQSMIDTSLGANNVVQTLLDKIKNADTEVLIVFKDVMEESQLSENEGSGLIGDILRNMT